MSRSGYPGRESGRTETSERDSSDGGHLRHAGFFAMAVASLGVVFGDIGTSPLYAFKDCVQSRHGFSPTPENVFGILSLIFWSLTMVVTVKYVTFLMKADNRGEGGILALLGLVSRDQDHFSARSFGWITGLVIFGAALLYGDGIITPAISVLSAVEGLGVAEPRLKFLVLPLTTFLLAGLFGFQKRGTAGVARVFSPIMTLWFLTLAVLGLVQIFQYPSILFAISPTYAFQFFVQHKLGGIMVLGSVFLVVTGSEALYADMGHLGLRPIRAAWNFFVMPALVLNYFGQGALLIRKPEAAADLFFEMAPRGVCTYLLVALATAATIIASQALISGAYSLTRQAVQLGFFPRVTIVHTSRETEGQIYIPEITWSLAVGSIFLVYFFKESSRLAAAYGIAVTGTMVITSIVYLVVLLHTWKWPRWKAVSLVGLFLSFDVIFMIATSFKFSDGGYVPILVAAFLFTVMTTWKSGRALLARTIAQKTVARDGFLSDVRASRPQRVPGTAVFMVSSPNAVPASLVHHFKHNHILHETVILLSILVENEPEVPRAERIRVVDLGEGFYQITAHYGFMQTPHAPSVLRDAAALHKVPIVHSECSFYIGRETLLPTEKAGMSRWRKVLFVLISKNSQSATKYFGIPANKVIEIGIQIDL